ncbi:hypothetical protein J4Q44_G00244140 [Coregonus suidteri]|uniref:Uncharacterized protein n=1 Tax=Coregonus suidteri TaxID=861788 RepID=A0AAN8L318_9TELE
MSPLSRLNIIWTFAPFSDPDSPTQVIVFDHGQVIENPSLRGRVGTQASPGVLTSSSTTHAYQTLAPIAAAGGQGTYEALSR